MYIVWLCKDWRRCRVNKRWYRTKKEHNIDKISERRKSQNRTENEIIKSDSMLDNSPFELLFKPDII
jgi:hypothetical protein